MKLRWVFLVLAAPLAAVDIHYTLAAKSVVETKLRGAPQSNELRELALRTGFEDAGCSGDRLHEQPVPHIKAPNVICEMPGETNGTIIVGAHSDFVARGHGVVDNWSGCSLLPFLYESLKNSPRRHRFLFVAFTAEEQGLIGSAFFVKKMSKIDLANTSAMVNLDSLGTSPTKVELTRGDKDLASKLAAVSRSVDLPVTVVNVHQVGRSDSDSFQDKKVPAINLHSLTAETWPLLHSPRDRWDAIHFDEYYDSYRLIAAYLAYLDASLETSKAPAARLPAVPK